MIRTKIKKDTETIEKDMVFIKITNNNKYRPFGLPASINETTENIVIFDKSDYNLFNQQMEKSDYNLDVFKESFFLYPRDYIGRKDTANYRDCSIVVNINNKKIQRFNNYRESCINPKSECNERFIQIPLKVVEELDQQISEIFNFNNGTAQTFNFTRSFYESQKKPKILNIDEEKFYSLKNLLCKGVPTFTYFKHSDYISISKSFSCYFHLFYGVLYKESGYLKYILKNIYNESKEVFDEIRNGSLPIFDVMGCESIMLYPILTDYAKLKIISACEELGL